MATKMFVNLPVTDLPRSMAFYQKLGFSFNPQFTDETAACMVVSEENYAMLLTEKKFQEFTPKAIADSRKTAEVLVAISTGSRQAVDEMCRKAFANGGRKYKEPQDHGFMYAWGFEDPDGHTWEPFWMEPSFVQDAQPEPASAAKSR